MRFLAFMQVAAIFAALLVSAGHAQGEENAHSVGCLPALSVKNPASVCTTCHKDGESRWQSNRHRPCTPYCTSCHSGEQLERHHLIGIKVNITPPEGIRLTSDGRSACFTCHDISNKQYDTIRWKAASMFDRMFKSQERYKTYFLVKPNDHGQLCLSCH